MKEYSEIRVVFLSVGFLFLLFTAPSVTYLQAQTQTENLTQTIEQISPELVEKGCGTDLILCIHVLYESPTRIAFEADYITLLHQYNPIVWEVVDMLEAKGFAIDSILLAGQGNQGNPHKFHIVMSK